MNFWPNRLQTTLLFIAITFCGMVAFATDPNFTALESDLDLSSPQTANLLTAYQDAVRNDPTFQEQLATLQQAEQSIPEARANLLPQLILSAQVSHTYQNSRILGYDDFNSNQYTLSFNQAIFNLSALTQLHQAKASVQAAATLFSAQEQDLIVRLVRAYLAVLQTQDLMSYTKQQMQFAENFYAMTNKRFKLKYATVTDMDQAKQQYRLIQSQYVTASINYYRSVQDLSTITARLYRKFSGFKANFPLIKPNPESGNAWVALAKQQNLFLRAAQFDAIAAQRQIAVQKANYAPSVSAITNYSDVNELSTLAVGGVPETVKTTTVGVDFSWNMIQGGLTIAQVRQAAAAYAQSIATMRKRYLEAITNTNKAYFGVSNGILRVQESRQAVVAGLSGLNNAEAGFRAGVQSIFDLLQAQNRLFESERQYVGDFYNYIIDTVLLKQATGTLCPEDVYQLNRWLSRAAYQSATLLQAPPTIKINPYQPKTTIKVNLSAFLNKLALVENEAYSENSR